MNVATHSTLYTVLQQTKVLLISFYQDFIILLLQIR